MTCVTDDLREHSSEEIQAECQAVYVRWRDSSRWFRRHGGARWRAAHVAMDALCLLEERDNALALLTAIGETR